MYCVFLDDLIYSRHHKNTALWTDQIQLAQIFNTRQQAFKIRQRLKNEGYNGFDLHVRRANNR